MVATAVETKIESQPQNPEAFGHLLQLASGFMMTSAIYTMAKLNIADLMRQGPRLVSELASATNTNEDALYRVLRLLASAGAFTESSPRTFGLTPPVEFLRTDTPGSIRDLVLWIGNSFHFKVWAELSYSVATGQSAAEKVYGKPCFELFGDLPDVAREFNAAMTCMSALNAPAILEAYDFSSIETLMDVAGGHGFLLCKILEQYPHMKGVILDLPEVISGAKDNIKSLRLEHRCEPTEGNFFKSIPAGADAIFMQHIIHDWNDEHALKILRNCHKALEGKKNAKLLVVDSVVEPGPEPSQAKLLDIEMLLMPGGKERTREEFRALFAKAGFELTRIVSTKCPESVIEARLK